MQKSQINSEITQAMFDSAYNAADKGQSQWYTPIEFGRSLADALPKIRPVITDLNCGGGHLLQASATRDTHTLLGCDIDPCRSKSVKCSVSSIQSASPLKTENLKLETLPITRIAYDLTKLYPLLVEVDWVADLFVLNPPWRLYWYRDRLEALAKSEHPAVRQAFAGIEDGIPAGTIDSTIATLLIALDRCTIYGEGMLIANNNTLDRLIFREGAPHAALAKHIWARVVVPGNPMTGIDGCNFVHVVPTENLKLETENSPTPFSTGIIYFAIGHTNGCKDLPSSTLHLPSSPSRISRQGSELRIEQLANRNCVDLWAAVRDRVRELEGAKPKVPWNLWLDNGVIRTALSSFEQHSVKINKTEAGRLHKLYGKKPMQCVLQRADRKELLQVCDEGGWKVQPELRAAVQFAITEYHGARAPLYPLPEIQRLGYLDEQDEIECKLDLMFIPEKEGQDEQDLQDKTSLSPSSPHPAILSNPVLLFKAGEKYPIRTQTVSIKRTVSKPNPFTGELEKLEYSGQELAIYLATESEEFCFMDAKLKDDEHTQIPNTKRSPGSARVSRAPSGVAPDGPLSSDPVDFTLQELCRHFVVPDVPDVATVNPEGYANNVNLLTQLEELTESLRSSACQPRSAGCQPAVSPTASRLPARPETIRPNKNKTQPSPTPTTQRFNPLTMSNRT